MVAPYAEPGITYRWDFGDGTGAGSRQSVGHSYLTEGQYSVKLVINDSLHGCADSSVRINALRIEDPVPAFSMSDSFKACPPLLVQFTNESLNASDELWDFGDGSSTTTHTPSHFYSYPGVYTITLTVKGRGGCSRQTQKKVVVKGPEGVISFDPFNICTERTVHYKVQSTDAVSYTWDFNDGTTVDNSDTAISHTYTNAGGYMPKIILIDEKGCRVPVTGKDSVQIRAPFKMIVEKPGKVCVGQSKKLQASGAASYQWFPAVGLDNASIATPVAKPANSTTYKVIGTDDKGCYRDSGMVTVDIAPLPMVDAGADKKIAAGTPLDLVPNISADVTEVRWSPTGAIFRNSESAITVKPDATTEYTVEVKNAAGCAARDKVNVTVTKAGGEFFVPNSFSPNGDGMNDVFYPRSAVTVRINSLKIINRFGVVVFERSGFSTNDVNAGWDGNNRGVRLLPDVYIYVISMVNADNKPQIIQGDVALIR
jgi:gliding motility-associated-like protein